MKVGFYKNDLVEPVAFYDPDSESVIREVAEDFAAQEHQIDEQSDMNFTVYVEDDKGTLHEVEFFTEFEPVFEVKSVRHATCCNG